MIENIESIYKELIDKMFDLNIPGWERFKLFCKYKDLSLNNSRLNELYKNDIISAYPSWGLLIHTFPQLLYMLDYFNDSTYDPIRLGYWKEIVLYRKSDAYIIKTEISKYLSNHTINSKVDNIILDLRDRLLDDNLIIFRSDINIIHFTGKIGKKSVRYYYIDNENNLKYRSPITT